MPMIKAAHISDGSVDQQNRMIHSERNLLDEMQFWVKSELFEQAVHEHEIIDQLCRILDVPDPWEIRLALTLSKLGGVAPPRTLFAKIADGVDLNADEKESLCDVPAVGRDFAGDIPALKGVARIILNQSKSFARGCEDGPITDSNTLPMGARILKAANDYNDYLQEGLSSDEAVAAMKRHCRLYDPVVLDAVDALFAH